MQKSIICSNPVSPYESNNSKTPTFFLNIVKWRSEISEMKIWLWKFAEHCGNVTTPIDYWLEEAAM